MIAYCGLDCEKCDALIATKNNDNALRQKLAEQWSKEFNMEAKPEDIYCTGCKSDGIKLHYCQNLCEIRKCAMDKKIDTCAPCSDYPCDKLDYVLGHSPEAKARLESLRAEK